MRQDMHVPDDQPSDLFDALVDSSGYFGQPLPSPYLEAKIMRRLEAEMAGPARTPAWGLRLRLAGVVVLLALNVATVLFLARSQGADSSTASSGTDYWAYSDEIVQTP